MLDAAEIQLDAAPARPKRPKLGRARVVVAALALLAVAAALVRLEGAERGLVVEYAVIDGTPATIRRPAAGPAGPAVVIAHGFAGSRQLMAPFAVSLARAGYTTVAFDFQGHGRNTTPLRGDVTREDGATAALVSETRRMLAAAREPALSDGRVALLGHSMASDIIVRAAIEDDDVSAVVAVSMFSQAVTADAPANLLIVAGGYETFLADAALDALALSAGDGAVEAQTYGAFEDGSARRVSLADGVEHVGVLYSREALVEARDWLNAAFGRDASADVDARGPWVILLLTGIVAAAWPLSTLLPRIAAPRPPLGLRAWALAALAPAAAAPLILAVAPWDVLPVLVADYVAAHFAVHGLLALAALWACGVRIAWPNLAAAAAALAIGAYGLGAIGAALDAYVANFWPHAGRIGVILYLLPGAALFCVADALANAGAPLWRRIASKIAVLLSLAAAIALNLEDLFFLAIIFPVIILFFILYGLFARWSTQATGRPELTGVANGVVFAWALGVTFPLLG